jgi:hypothetical protein
MDFWPNKSDISERKCCETSYVELTYKKGYSNTLNEAKRNQTEEELNMSSVVFEENCK